LPPEALSHPIAELPDSLSFRRQIANHLPSRKVAPIWFRAVTEAAELADEAFAVWIAKEIVRDRRSVKLERLRLVALWSWYSNRPSTFGHTLIEKCWKPDLRIQSVLDGADDWRTMIGLHVNLGREPITELWLRPARVCGYDFRPLTSVSEIAEEAIAMSNCLRTYGYNLAHNRSRLWSVRKDGQRVSTLKIAFAYGDPLPHVRELKGVGNSKAPFEVWWAARQWLNMHDFSRLDPKQKPWDSAPLDRSTWISLWRPYWLAKRQLPDWLPLAPSRKALEKL
jgi:hypothetical protein